MRHVKERITAYVRDRAAEMTALSRAVNARPELAFEEHETAGLLVRTLTAGGRFSVERGVAGLPTAFVATAGTGELEIGICAEMDALPGVGHGCGHNVIAAAAVTAGLALAEVADELGITVRVLGTPAEERGAGKVLMLEAGVFDGLHAAMMVHPTLKDMVTPKIRATRMWQIAYTGREAHASRPREGRNAADAAVIAQTAIGLLRQQLPDGVRVHYVVKEAGAAVNIIPGRAVIECMIRCDTLAQVDATWRRVRACFEAGALAAGVEIEVGEPLLSCPEFRHDPDLARLFQANAEALGRTFPDYEDRALGSTDMANVSHHVPSIHPVLSLDAPPEHGNHTAGFAAAAGSATGDLAVLDGGLAMALTVADLATSEVVRARLIAGRASRSGAAV
ncbi:amidohydrolase [Thermocatellispora tengchongensis]|uniref:Peptidase M20 domain-containing protein 2 n=1 Tax=Thermocatellispora tengchongensis TaxID=1073253 RepID=A0A840NXM9_9ACTN|nr:amidohydrolase [Thermocatellispora tengchongensis]MBB5131539.1 amidohydrolase [Thermocatellispora tengchongensis]